MKKRYSQNQIFKFLVSIILVLCLVLSNCSIMALATEGGNTKYAFTTSKVSWDSVGSNLYSANFTSGSATNAFRMYSTATPQVSSKGTFNKIGYIENTDSTLPITGCDNFKIDISFLITGDEESTAISSNDVCFLSLGSAYSASCNYQFRQLTSGMTIANGSAVASKNSVHSLASTELNGALTKNTNYHYVLSYIGGTLTGSVYNSSYSKLYDIFSSSVTLNSSNLKYIRIGDDNNTNLSRGYTWTSVTFSTPTSTDPVTFEEPNSESVGILKQGTVYSGSNTRYTAGTSPVINIVNDQEDSNFDLAFVTFDLSGLNGINAVQSAPFSFTTTTVESEPKGLTFYYASGDNKDSLVTGGNNLASTSIFGTENAHISKAITYFELVEVATLSSSTISANTSYTVDLADAFNNALLDGSSTCTVMIMQSSAGEKDSTNGWTDIKITFNPSTKLNATLSDCELDFEQGVNDINVAVLAYEEKMSKGVVYTNMSAAYDAYVNCQKAYDAYYYGEKSNINLSSYAKKLVTATNDMTVWSKPTASVVPAFKSGEITSTNSATNCVWAETLYEPTATYTGSNNTTYQEYHHSSVYIYDDNAPKIPTMIGLYKATSLGSPGKPKVWYANLSSSNGGLYVVNSNYVGDITDKTFTTSISGAYSIGSTVGNSTGIIVSTGDVRYMANYYSVNESAVNNGTGYVKAYPNTIVFGVSDYNDSAATKTESLSVGSGNPIYVLYYKPLYQKLSDTTLKSYIANVCAYKEGGLSSLMKAYDIATSVNPKGYDYSSDTENKVTTCANAITSAVSNFNNLDTPAKDSDAYALIRSNIENANNNYSSNDTISTDTLSTTRYSESSYSAFKASLDEAKGAMKSVLSLGYTSSYNNKTINTVAAALTNSIAGLKYNYITQFYSHSGEYLGSKVYAQDEYTDVDLYSNSPMAMGTNDNRCHKTYSWQSTQLTKEKYGNSVSVRIDETETSTPCILTDAKVVTFPTCESSGLEQQSCDICGAVYTNTLSPAGHTFNDTVVAPTCTAKGYTLHKCTKCDYTYTDSETDMISHNYVETVVAPTCETGGYTAKKCTVCGNEIVDENTKTAPLGHIYTRDCLMIADCISGELVQYTCQRCNCSYCETSEINSNVHSNLIYARTVAPTETQMGYDIYYCSYLCGYWEKRNIVAPTGIAATQGNYSEYLATYNEAYKYIETDYTPYTRDSINAYWAQISAARDMAENAINTGSPADIDTATKMILEAHSLLVEA